MKKFILAWFAIILLFVATACAKTPTSDLATAVPSRDVSITVEASRPAGNGEVASPTVLPATASATDANETEEPMTSTTDRSFAGTVPAPEFPPGLEWLNVARPLTLTQLRGKVVLLDFWTYGCINCMHVIPDLKRLEEKYADELVVIGVHSAKFENEGDTNNIRQIVRRYELEHPVVNDKNFGIWRAYGAQAWPTFVLIDPEGRVLGFHAGEGIYGLFDEIIAGMIAHFDVSGRIDRTPLALTLEQEGLANSPLLFPGKVLADQANNRLFIADSNHNRIVVTDLDGRVLAVIGNGHAALQDGDYETASFFRPQGLALSDANTLYVADTENHAIRRVDLQARLVETVAGNGRQGGLRTFEGRGSSISLNSPWDVLVHDGLVYVAMAGQHQLWLYDPATQVARVFAGSGREELEDGSLLSAGLNQPSGLATDGERLYVADSEASAIRSAGLTPAGEGVQTIVGTGLFDFGDVDGTGITVRLQHPLGVVFNPDDGWLYVADTYNSKIKRVHPETRASVTFLGGDASGWRDGAEPLFDEPGGLSLAGDKLYVADTNNHVIRVADLNSGETTTIVLVDGDGLLTRQPEGEAYSGKVVTLEPQTVAAGEGTLRLQVNLPPGYKVNDLAPFSAEWIAGEGIELAETAVSLVKPSFPLDVTATFEGSATLQGDLVIYYCEATAESLCYIEQVRLLLPVTVAENDDTTLTVTHTIPKPPDT